MLLLSLFSCNGETTVPADPPAEEGDNTVPVDPPSDGEEPLPEEKLTIIFPSDLSEMTEEIRPALSAMLNWSLSSEVMGSEDYYAYSASDELVFKGKRDGTVITSMKIGPGADIEGLKHLGEGTSVTVILDEDSNPASYLLDGVKVADTDISEVKSELEKITGQEVKRLVIQNTEYTDQDGTAYRFRMETLTTDDGTRGITTVEPAISGYSEFTLYVPSAEYRLILSAGGSAYDVTGLVDHGEI